MSTAALVRLLPAHELKIKYLFHCREDMTWWENKFISDIRRSRELTGPQVAKLEEIYEALRHGREIICYREMNDETWEDVHNFDRD